MIKVFNCPKEIIKTLRALNKKVKFQAGDIFSVDDQFSKHKTFKSLVKDPKEFDREIKDILARQGAQYNKSFKDLNTLSQREKKRYLQKDLPMHSLPEKLIDEDISALIDAYLIIPNAFLVCDKSLESKIKKLPIKEQNKLLIIVLH